MHSILIVDDIESIHEILNAVIEPIGFNTAFATDGPTAIEMVEQNHYDIVLTDINMKPMDGLDLLEKLKAINPNIIVVMMSGYATIENATRSLKLGAFDFITKPFKVDELIAAINRATKESEKLSEAS